MKGYILELMHWMPLAIIAVSAAANFVAKIVSGKTLLGRMMVPFSLVLSSIGIMSGSIAHHGHEAASIFDPCIGYCFVLVAIAASTYVKKAQSINAQ